MQILLNSAINSHAHRSRPCTQCGRWHTYFEQSLVGTGQLRDRVLKTKISPAQLPQKEVDITTWLPKLVAQVGGTEAILAAAFGDRTTASRATGNRRQFLQRIVLGTMLVTLNNCAMNPTPADQVEGENNFAQLEKRQLKIAFLPITCATPIILAQPLGFYEKYGLTVELIKMAALVS